MAPKLPDAVHAVTAIRSGCRLFLSNDGGLKLPVGMQRYTTETDGIAAVVKELA